MSISKLLIQKEIDKYTRGINFCKKIIKAVSDKDSPPYKKLTKDELAENIKHRKVEISDYEKAIIELKADLKKL